MRLLLIGDIVGKPGRQVTVAAVAELKRREQIDLVVANAENAAGGSGITPEIYYELTQAGVDAITLGDHIYRRREIYPILETKENIVKPANYPPEAPGREVALIPSAHGLVAVISLLGRVFMKPVDCPFAAADRVLATVPQDVSAILVDFHAEATSDKQLLGRYLDGRVSAVLGTHTHVTTADERILPLGTAFQCDVGMTGPHESILGRRIDRVLTTTRTFRPEYFDVASEGVELHGTLVDVEPASRQSKAIRRLALTASQVQKLVRDQPGPEPHQDS